MGDDVQLVDVYSHESKRLFKNLTNDIDGLIERLQVARERLKPDTVPTTLTGSMGASLARDLAEVLGTATQLAMTQNIIADLRESQG